MDFVECPIGNVRQTRPRVPGRMVNPMKPLITAAWLPLAQAVLMLSDRAVAFQSDCFPGVARCYSALSQPPGNGAYGGNTTALGVPR